jgi:putative ABC transport system permease protein
MTGGRRLAALRAWCGTAVASHVALAVLVLGCTCLGLAGPRVALGTRTDALRRTVAGLPAVTTAVAANAGWNTFTSALPGTTGVSSILTAPQLSHVTGALARDLGGGGLPLSPPAARWASLTTKLSQAAGLAGPPGASAPPQLELIYRDPLGRHASLTAGRFPAAARQPGGRLGVVITGQTAGRMGLRVGSRFGVASGSGLLRLVVTGILRERDPRSAFWTSDQTAAQPALAVPPNRPSFWVAGVFIGPGELGPVQAADGPLGIQLQWEFPLALGGLRADQAQLLYDQLDKATAQVPELGGGPGGPGATVTVTNTLAPTLAAFLTAAAQVGSVLSLLFTGLAATAAVVILLAGWMLVQRRDGDFAVLRARGATAAQLSAVMLRGTALACVPAALLGGGLAVAATPASPAVAGWWLSGLVVAAGLLGPPAAVAWRYRPARRARAGRRLRARRLVAEGALTAAAIGGILLLHKPGAAPAGAPGAAGGGVYPDLAPVLVAVPAVLLVMRLYPLAVRGLLRLSARRAGATGFLALARAARAPAGTALPLFALVLALALAAFSGMVRAAVARGDVAASWQATGADAVINVATARGALTPAARHAITAVPGARRATAVRVTSWTLPGQQAAQAVAVAPASYAALVASTPSAPVRARQLSVLEAAPGRAARAAGVPVLASPSMAAALGRGPVTLTAVSGPGSLRVHVAGVIASTPALPGSHSFLIMGFPGAAAAGQPAQPTMMLLTGNVSGPGLAAAIRRTVPGARLTLRSAALAALAGAPLQHGAVVLLGASAAAAAGFTLAALVAGLALGAADRRQTLSRLAAMGFGAGQARRLVLLEQAPALLAAAVAGTACALILPALTASSLDLSVFTGSSAAVPVRPDLVTLAIPVAGLALLAAAAATGATRAWRDGGVSTALRIGG